MALSSSERSKRYYELHRAEVIARSQARYVAQRERIREQKRLDRQQNPEKYHQQYLARAEHAKAYAKEYRLRDPAAYTDKYLQRVYGITLAQYNEMVEAQDGKCAICHLKPEGQRLCVDHCHLTQKVRGLLCNACNRGIGSLKDSLALLRAAILYLELHG